MRRVPVFFYGLFMDADLLRAKGANPANIRRAAVSGLALRIGARATLVPQRDARVFGIVMDLTHDEIDRLYAESSVSVYRPEAVIAEIDDRSTVAALCFVLPIPPAPDERNEAYAAKLRALAERLGLPAMDSGSEAAAVHDAHRGAAAGHGSRRLARPFFDRDRGRARSSGRSRAALDAVGVQV